MSSILDKIRSSGNTQDVEKEQLKAELQKCNTVAEGLRLLLDRYDLDSVKLGILSKPIAIDGILKLYDNLKPERK